MKAIDVLTTGFKSVNDLIGGLRNGKIHLVSGRTSSGKTAFVINIAEHVAFYKKRKILFFSLESSIERLAKRILSSECMVDGTRLILYLSQRDWLLKQLETPSIANEVGLGGEVHIWTNM